MYSETLESRISHKRADQLQFLRFLAFLNIFTMHADAWLFFSYPAGLAANAAVSFFFMLSGLVTGYSAFGKKVEIGFKEETRYMRKRILRVYPLYFLTTLFCAFLSGTFSGIIRSGYVISSVPKQLIRNLFLVQSWFTEGYFSYNVGGWFLSTLLFLNLFNLPCTFLLNKFHEQPNRTIKYSVYFGAVIALFGSIVVYCYFTQNMHMEYWQYVFPPARMAEYIAGMIMGFVLHAFTEKWEAKTWIRIVCTVLEMAVLVYWVRALNSPGNYWRNRIVSWIIPNAMVLSVFTLEKGYISALFRLKPFVALGDCAFEAYLIHWVLIMIFTTFGLIPTDVPYGNIAAYFLCLFFSVAFAFLVKGPQRK